MARQSKLHDADTHGWGHAEPEPTHDSPHVTVRELLTQLIESGTGDGKVKAAHAFLKQQGMLHHDADACELVDAMERDGGWPEGTVAKARRILQGQPAALANRSASQTALDDMLADAGDVDDGLDHGKLAAMSPEDREKAKAAAVKAPRMSGQMLKAKPGEGAADSAADGSRAPSMGGHAQHPAVTVPAGIGKQAPPRGKQKPIPEGADLGQARAAGLDDHGPDNEGQPRKDAPVGGS